MKQQSITRQFTPYEKNQLRKYGIDEGVARRYGKMPVEYITGHVEFFGLDFLIDQRALIPRVETEEIIEKLLDEFSAQPLLKLSKLAKGRDQIPHHERERDQGVVSQKQRSKKQTDVNQTVKILEVGTGSGAVAISLAYQLEKTNQKYHIIATDIDEKALELARKNLNYIATKYKMKNIKSQVDFIHSDLFANVPKEKFNAIIANLPYIPTARIKVLDASVKDFEPWVALDGGSDGLRLISKFLNQADKYLKDQGVILLEIDYTHPDLLKQHFGNKYQVKTWVSSVSRCIFAKLKQKN